MKGTQSSMVFQKYVESREIIFSEEDHLFQVIRVSSVGDEEIGPK